MSIAAYTLNKNKKRNLLLSGLAVLIVVAVGYAVIGSRASGFFALFDAKDASVSGNATLVDDPTISGGKALVFGTAPPVGGGELDLPRIPWEGGPAYWKQFPKADAAGWDDPSFFPISVFLGKAEQSVVASLKDAGINLYMAVEHSPEIFPLTNITDQGLFAMPNLDPEDPKGEWTPAEVDNNPKAVAWFITDECDMGYSGCTGDQYNQLAFQTTLTEKVRGYNDGRFLHSNYGNGVVRTHWSPDTMDDQVKLMDSSSVDKYAYTSPDVDDLLINSPDWTAARTPAAAAKAAAYGWMTDQMRRFQDPNRIRPIWGFVETARPYLNEAGARTITPDQIEGAVWSSLIHEGRGIAYFQHNNNEDPAKGCTGGTSIVECANVHSKIKAINTKIKSLAPVLNTQSYHNSQININGKALYRYTFNNGTDTMLKTYNGSAYIFADIGLDQTPGTKTFTLPAGVNGTTATVVGENRSITITNRTFSDNFTNEYTHHVYKIAL